MGLYLSNRWIPESATLMVKPLVASMSERAWLDEMQRAQLTAYLVAARQLRALCFGVVLAFAQSMLCFGLHCKRTHLACGAGMAREIIACLICFSKSPSAQADVLRRSSRSFGIAWIPPKSCTILAPITTFPWNEFTPLCRPLAYSFGERTWGNAISMAAYSLFIPPFLCSGSRIVEAAKDFNSFLSSSIRF